MRSLIKLNKPQILADNEVTWLSQYKSDKTNPLRKYRYRHHDIKSRLKEETGYKCIYCESKIGHNTPGEVEHKIPSSKVEDLHFTWENLTIACTECNRRKNDYYEIGMEFLDPYVDNVEDLIQHHGPVTFWQPGNPRAEISIRTLELNSYKRTDLIARKIEKMEEVSNLYERYLSQADPVLKLILHAQIHEMRNSLSEYSGMVNDVLEKHQFV